VLDLRLIRENPEGVQAALATTGIAAPIAEIVAADERRRALLTEVEALKAELNAGSKLVGRTREPAEREALIAANRVLGDRIASLDEAAKAADARLQELMLLVPNLPLPHVPVGADERGNVVVAEHRSPKTLPFPVKPHWELAEALGIIDFERGVKISGSRFYVLRGDGARLQRALIAWMLDLHSRDHGYQEIYPPALVLEQTLVGTGNLPKFGDALFRDAHEDKWLSPTAEVPVTNLYRDEILDEALLPIYHVAYSPCFRRSSFRPGATCAASSAATSSTRSSWSSSSTRTVRTTSTAAHRRDIGRARTAWPALPGGPALYRRPRLRRGRQGRPGDVGTRLG
jgi:seryl-tRNA synthetase